MAMPLPKYKKKICVDCGNVIAKNGRKKKLWLPKSGEEFKKKSVTFTIFLQQIIGD